MTLLLLDRSIFRRIFYKIEDLFRSPKKLPPDNQRQQVEFPQAGYSTSVEMALNSRCTSDYDENPKKFHWGMFDFKKKLSDAQIEEIIQLAKIPHFTDKKAEIHFEKNILTFVTDNCVQGIVREYLMVESGMQQQAVGLVCAALGVGMVFRYLGKDGTAISDTEWGTIRMRLDPMKPSYNGKFWSNLAPANVSHQLKGDLLDPDRDGDKPLISTLSDLEIENKGLMAITDRTISQLLWAARGRTPHFYKSRPWGMTIPTCAGIQNISTIYLILDNRLLEYKNWHKNKPAHALLALNTIESHSYEKVMRAFSANLALILLAKNESFARALWEVGYQLLNLMLQASSIGISYRAFLLNNRQKAAIVQAGVSDPVAILAI